MYLCGHSRLKSISTSTPLASQNPGCSKMNQNSPRPNNSHSTSVSGYCSNIDFLPFAHHPYSVFCILPSSHATISVAYEAHGCNGSQGSDHDRCSFPRLAQTNDYFYHTTLPTPIRSEATNDAFKSTGELEDSFSIDDGYLDRFSEILSSRFTYSPLPYTPRSSQHVKGPMSSRPGLRLDVEAQADWSW